MLNSLKRIRIPNIKLLFGGSLGGTLVRSLLLLTIIPLMVIAAAVYARTRDLPFTSLLVLASLITMAFVILLGTNRSVRPLHNITAIIEKFAKGDLSSRAEGGERKDDIGELARSFNQMADEVSDLYRSLELKVDERTRQVRTAAEVAQSLTTLTSLDDLLSKTVELLVRQFEYYEAHIFMIDRAGKTATLRAARGPAASTLLERGHRLDVGSDSIIGWVSAKNKPRVASDVSADPIHFKNELLPETKAEASVPISIGNLVLGVLDVQSINAGAFSPETVVMLETLASQIAVAIQNVGLVETTQVNFQELSRLYRSTRSIAESKTEQEILELSGSILREAPFPVVLIALRENDLEILTIADTPNIIGETIEFQRYLSADISQIKKVFQAGPIITDSGDSRIPLAMVDIVRRLGFDSAAFLPIRKGNELAAVVILGAKRQVLTNSLIQPYINLADLVSASLEKITLVSGNAKRANELEALSSINKALTTSQDMPTFFSTLHEHVRGIIGDYSFTIALYDERKNTISIPYNFDDNKLSAVDPFPLGEGMTSVLIHTRQPLLLVHDAERQATLLGAKVIGRPARSWMGAPMIAQDSVVGALIIQDLDREYMFNDSDLKFLKSLADQVAGVINNARLLDESKQRALQLEIAADISRDIGGSLNIDELLVKAVTLIRERFEFYHAAIFLIDAPFEFAVIREATGDAGQQMKRMGHKISIGSKSIVGFVSGRGERLVVNDTTKDATYFANPLLPNTRAEAAMPMKVGDRILGVLDVQSDHAYAFTEDNLRSIQLLSDQLAIAVVNTELFAETQEHLSQHRLLHHITATAASGTTLEEALEGAVNGLQVTLGGDRVAILLADRSEKLLEVMAVVGYSEDVANLKIPIGTGISGSAAQQRRALRINDVTKDSRYIQVSPNTRSELAVPLIYRNELLGVINVESEKVEAYSDDDEEMLGTLGGSLAAIIANARLLEQIRDKAERDRTIYEITGKIRKSTDIQTILATTATELTKVVGARRTKIEVTPQELDQDGSAG
jgi:GAF domain-containing protein/HAMP domain-containing protein